jgi:hypothetical protein
MIGTNRELTLKIGELERAVSDHEEQIGEIFEAIRQMVEKKNEPRNPVGY